MFVPALLACLAPAPVGEPQPRPEPAPSAALTQPEATPAAEPPLGFALSFGFEPRLGSYRDLDTTLADYGFAPVAKLHLLSFGLRGRIFTPRGWIFGGTMSYAFALSHAPDNPVPTALTHLETSLRAGHQLGLGFDTTLSLGFNSHTLSVGSTAQGGALLYLGPSIQPQVGYTLPTGTAFLHLFVGYALTVPVGAAHQNELWEEDFSRPAVHAFAFGIESGFAFKRPQFRWRETRRRE